MAKKANPPADPSLQEWLKQKMRFGKSDDSIIVFIPSHQRNKQRVLDQEKWASDALDLMGRL